MKRKLIELIHEAKYAAEVVVEFSYGESWSPTMSLDDARTLEIVRLAFLPWRYCRSGQTSSSVRTCAGCGKIAGGRF